MNNTKSMNLDPYDYNEYVKNIFKICNRKKYKPGDLQLVPLFYIGRIKLKKYDNISIINELI